jgi:hypothetical protein
VRSRPPVKGARLPSLAEQLRNRRTSWRRVTLDGWYGHTTRRLDIVSGTALWHHPGMRVAIRWVLVRDPTGKRKPQAFLCTDLRAEPADILRWFVRRWRTETTFEEVRRHLGMETQRQWSDRAIQRTPPRAARPVLPHGAVGGPTCDRAWTDGRVHALVPQAAANLQRRSCTHPARIVDRAGFRHLTG